MRIRRTKVRVVGALVRAGVAQVLVIRQIAWMAVCVPGRARCQCAGACQRASVPVCQGALDR